MGASLVYLERPNKEIEFEEGENDHIRYVAGSMQGWRINMEDTHIADLSFNKESKLALFGVFDGHGGKEVAHYTKQHFDDYLRSTSNYKQQKFDEALRESFLKIDEELEKDTGKEELAVMKRKCPPNKSPLFKILGETLGNGAGSNGNPADQTIDQMMLDSIGCTANVILVEDMKKLYVANAGDSRCVLSRGGVAVPLSFDHKPENEEERARIEKAGSVITEGRVDGNLNLSRSLGDLKYKQNKKLKPEEHPVTAYPDLYTYDLTPEDDFIIMGCDGIWETKTNQQMVDFLSDKINSGKTIKTIISELLEDIISPDYSQTNGVGCDNMTCILIVFKKST